MFDYNLYISDDKAWWCHEDEQVRIERTTAGGKPIMVFRGDIQDLGARIEDLQNVLAAIVNDATGDVNDQAKRLWPIRSANGRRAKELLDAKPAVSELNPTLETVERLRAALGILFDGLVKAVEATQTVEGNDG